MNSQNMNVITSDPTSLVSGILDPTDANRPPVKAGLEQLEVLARQPIPIDTFTISKTTPMNALLWSFTRTSPFDGITHVYENTWRNNLLAFYTSGVYSSKLSFQFLCPDEYKFKVNARIWNYYVTNTGRDRVNRRNNDTQFLSTDGRVFSIQTMPIANFGTYNYMQQNEITYTLGGNSATSPTTVWRQCKDLEYMYRVELYLDFPLQAPVAQADTIDVIVYETMNFQGTHINGGYTNQFLDVPV